MNGENKNNTFSNPIGLKVLSNWPTRAENYPKPDDSHYAVLPDAHYDELFIHWGFEPYVMPTSQKPNVQKFVETTYALSTDIITIRFEEDILADEYIVETAKTQSPPPDETLPPETNETIFRARGMEFALKYETLRSKNATDGWSESDAEGKGDFFKIVLALSKRTMYIKQMVRNAKPHTTPNRTTKSGTLITWAELHSGLESCHSLNLTDTNNEIYLPLIDSPRAILHNF